MLSGSTIVGPLPSPQETLNVQLLPGDVGALSQLTPSITGAGATVQATTISGLYEVEGPASNMAQLAEELSANPAVQYAQAVQTVQDQALPDDPDYVNGDDWQLNGTWGINAPGAWSVTTGSDAVIVADTDTGIDYDAPDLIDNVWINQAEIPASVLPNLTDVYDDGVITFTDLNNPVNQGPGKITPTDGVVDGTSVLAPTSAGGWADGSTQDGDTENPDDLIGWNYAAISTSAPNGTNNPIDQNGHGTFTAGEIAEVGNNGIGGTGVDWNVQLMPVQFLDSSGSGTDTAAADAIEYAVNHGAKVINASWGGSGTDPVIAAAIQYADENGVIIVCAAGNNGTDDDDSSTWFSPASYSSEYPNVISVAAIGSNGALASWSDYGVGTVQLAAPGVNVSGVGLSGYTTDSGTSMAAPLVTGTIALVEAAHPTWSMSQVIDAVLDTTTPDPALVGKVTTGGIVNAAAAVANTDGPYVVSATPDGSINNAGGFSSVEVDFNEEINPATFTPSEVTVTGPAGTISGVTVTAVAGSNDHEFTIAFPTQAAAGTFTVKVGPDIQDWYGNDMNQNRNGVNGKATDAFVETIRQTAPGSTDLLSVTGIPATVTAGSSVIVTVTALSPNGGTDTSFVGPIEFTSTDSQAVLPVGATFSAGDDGTETFTVTFKTAGAQSITATDTANPAIIGSESNIIVQAAAAQTLKVTGFPTTDTAGTAQTFSVTAYDAYGNVATSYTGTLEFASSDAQASLPADYTMTPEDQGTFGFTATLKTAGVQSITATDTSTASITGTESGIVVQSSAAKTLTIGGLPSSVTPGTPYNITVTAYDAYGNVATGYTGTVSFSSSDAKALLPSSYSFVASNAGTHTFSVTFETTGRQSVTATDTTTSTITGSASTTVGLGDSASLIDTDTSTEGNWIGNYGSQGYDLVAGAASLPSYATVTPSGESTYTWSTTTTVPQALEDPSGTGRIAASWYSGTSFTVDVNLNDGQTHDLELYFLDYDDLGRTEQVQISNAVTGAVLSTQTVSAFSKGVYLGWAVSGNILITITNKGVENAVLSGLFFGTATTSASVMRDGSLPNSPGVLHGQGITTAAQTSAIVEPGSPTEEDGLSAYNSQVDDITVNAASLPSDATATFSSDSSYSWTTTTADSEALNNAVAAGRIFTSWSTASRTKRIPTSLTGD
jgi:subtilisin family serine protease